ncbi:ribonuclease Y [Alkalibaculum sp. M08DMB]|uniref:Ribonuclease Y n=1 Tax=Alkalibaculum sporogenes TaxID=2655001 RepID=A0A6A7K911_9FIRM|nr:ribonuclease Y [Alkalibaculum sporogenes]MPW25811.1 ribonuclease Y [Alkalibaculum sporogenes]
MLEALGNSIFIVIPILIIIALVVGYLVRKYIAEGKIESAEQTANRIVEDALKEAETQKKETLLSAKEEIHSLRQEVDKENRERRNELQRLERRVIQREENVDKRNDSIQKKEDSLQSKLSELALKEDTINELVEKEMEELERISGLTLEEAKDILLHDVEKKIRRESALLIKRIETQAKEDGDKKAKEILSYAIQKCAADHVAETTVSVVTLPNDEMKGRIIGREGRNIRTLETLTGIDLIIDDTPEAVILSGFDPIRREIARVALEKLIIDGRIHPARIEEMVDKARKEVDNRIREDGEAASFETGIHGLHPEIIRLLGRLKFRTSYGQNVLKHSIEVAHLAGIMAEELGANVKIAKRAGLLHDIGKAVDHEVEGPHVAIGVDILKKHKESAQVIHAVEAHHEDIEATSIEAVLVQAADAVSAARPGARRETLHSYIKRLEKLEEISNSFEGVEKTFAIQAGREVRIMVKPDQVDDVEMIHIAKEIASKIQDELDYPGQIKVNVIRETRSIEYAK